MLEGQPLELILLHVGVDELVPEVGDRVDDEDRAPLLGLVHDGEQIGEGAGLGPHQADPLPLEHRDEEIRSCLRVDETDRLRGLEQLGEADGDEC
jgi:hypothetical protein